MAAHGVSGDFGWGDPLATVSQIVLDVDRRWREIEQGLADVPRRIELGKQKIKSRLDKFPIDLPDQPIDAFVAMAQAAYQALAKLVGDIREAVMSVAKEITRIDLMQTFTTEWQKIADELVETEHDLGSLKSRQLEHWRGEAAGLYQQKAGQQLEALGKLKTASRDLSKALADTMRSFAAYAVAMAGALWEIASGVAAFVVAVETANPIAAVAGAVHTAGGVLIQSVATWLTDANTQATTIQNLHNTLKEFSGGKWPPSTAA